ncbi:hypothetical protein CAter10_2874 [Collimonas arenae]|nr:hypothetical protein CAter10_2874 [Collimonas arenae]
MSLQRRVEKVLANRRTEGAQQAACGKVGNKRAKSEARSYSRAADLIIKTQ